ncbi:hypothetical protein M885DRAFT_520524 [Pelagophyceae sp. CCMP2097]|nr:hypothetical protein M885DRAFT_520524 [Pelagophyceae sp. CCMP2097]|mmetsp:Transcript_18493/g.62392  ORF Transcript_18493/g.62392 Transcript_18493/m.62392 type:complete len:520 (+) Transcript_18493:100-1659(+)
MAWRRGTQNQQAGVIRMGHVKEFLAPSSRASAEGSEKVKLKVVEAELLGLSWDACAAVASATGAAAIDALLLRDGAVLLHAHEHPAVVLRCVSDARVPEGCLALTEVQRLNSRVCAHDNPNWTLYRGRHEAWDAREASIGATQVKRALCLDSDLSAAVFEVRRRFEDDATPISLDAKAVAAALLRHTFDCIITHPELFVISVQAGSASVELVARVMELTPAAEDEDEDDECYRGRVSASTAAYVVVDSAAKAPLVLEKNVQPPPKSQRLDLVTVLCDDDEAFPVRRALLRPCIALTAVAQAGRGKYACDLSAELRVPMDCCTFDRVLLYLQHAAREEAFKFDPTLAQELLLAAQKLQLRGLQDAAQKVLGSFEERVRKTPIRFDEVLRRNAAGGAPCLLDEDALREETWLVLDGMVLDISRWLEEHPGGGTIIPEQALNVDCTAFFEIYHISRQSFLYLREFYIGELATQDRSLVPLPATQAGLPPGGAASEAFLGVLRRHTQWRIKKEDIREPNFKSF